MQNKIIKEIPITKKSKLVISIVKLSGKMRLDIRLHVCYTNKATQIEDFYPTAKGVNILLSKRIEIIEGLEEITEPAEKDSCE